MDENKLRICVKNSKVSIRQKNNLPSNGKEATSTKQPTPFPTSSADLSEIGGIIFSGQNSDKIIVKPTVSVRESPQPLDAFDSFFTKFTQKVDGFNLNHEEADEIFVLSEDLIVECFNLFKHIIRNLTSANDEYLTECVTVMRNKFRNYATRYKRQKIKSQDKHFVAPESKAVGVKWKANIDTTTQIPHHHLVQDRFIYIPILAQLKSLFLDEHFSKIYFEHNNKIRTFTDGTYRSYTSGSNYRDSELFKFCPDAIQIQLAYDDCQFACPVKTRTANYKLSCFYFQIKNMPSQYLSRNDSIYVVAICNNLSLKQEFTSLNNVLELVVSEISTLEKEGIDVGNNINLRGTLINMANDNLGANAVYGLPESFSSNYFCRHCECSKSESETIIAECSDKM